jgi:hypothetical protein
LNRTHRVVEKLAVNEEKIMELYSVFSDKFRESEQFWDEISGEKRQHAFMLRKFSETANGIDIKIELDYINEESIDRSISRLEGEIKNAKNDGIDGRQAFLLARTVEKGIMESEFFKIFNTNVKDLVKLFTELNSDTKRHYEMLSRKCETYCSEN